MPAKLFFYIFFWGFFIGCFFISILKNFTLKYRLLIAKGIPLVGGMGMAMSFILSTLVGFSICQGLNQDIVGILLASFLMFLFGVIDDWQELSVIAKFLVQIVATTLLIIFGVKTQIVAIGNFANLLITFIWVIGITNAFNHLDIIDGLSGGVGFIVSSFLFIIALLNADIKVMILSLALGGAILSFLSYNFHPAKVYMGNSGSHFLGFTLAAIALLISYAPIERKAALFSPLLILGLPIYDTAFLILVRFKNKRPIFRKSNDHLAFRFLSLGYSKKKAVIYVYILCLLFCISGLLVSKLPNHLSIIVIISDIFIALSISKRMARINNV